MIAENVKKALAEIAGGNNLGEKITLVAATKTRTADEINEAIEAGITDIGENKVLDEGYRTADIMSEGMKQVKGSEMTKLIVERI